MQLHCTEAVATGSLNPAIYNPRKADAERLRLLELSLRKLGFVLPIVADPAGEILSGHQRHLCSTRLGFETVPVYRVPPMTVEKRKALNLLFNRATNDFDASQTCATVKETLGSLRERLNELAEGLPDVEGHPCLAAVMKDADPILRANAARTNSYARTIAAPLLDAKIVMPIVVNEDGGVVNGIGRLEVMAARGMKAPIVTISNRQAEFAAAMLNLLTMDFSLEEQYADVLRHNSFRRARLKRTCLGCGIAVAISKRPNGKKITLEDASDRRKFIANVGRSVIDFGAGHGTEAAIIRRQCPTIEVTEFEPYRIAPGTNEISPKLSIEIANAFLDRVADRRPFSAVFYSSVFNSVPFAADREHMIRIGAALAARCYGAAQHINQPHISTPKHHNAMTRLEYEPGITLGSFHELPKVQKHFTTKEFYDLIKIGWSRVEVFSDGRAVMVRADSPQPVDAKQLRAALEFEFELPYPDGTRMNLSQRAISVFSERLRIDL